MNKEIYVTGSQGLVASQLTENPPKDFVLFTPEIDQLDITNLPAVRKYFDRENLSVIVNYAAFTNVEEAEKQRVEGENSLAWKINVEGALNLAKLAKEKGAFFVQISTDFVFSGTVDNPGPYKESDLPENDSKKLGWYGWTKRVAEQKLAGEISNLAVVRISYPYRAGFAGKVDFARSILDLYDQGKLYPLFSDQIITPTFIDEANEIIKKIVREKRKGIFHLASSDSTSPYEFGGYLLQKARGVENVVKEGCLEEYMKGKTPKPLKGGLEVSQTEENLGVKLMSWQEAVDKFVTQL